MPKKPIKKLAVSPVLKAPGKVARKTTPKPMSKAAAKKVMSRMVKPVAAPPSPDATAAVLDRLFTVITDRRTSDPAHSHSARLLSRGTAKVAQKFGEEAVECLIEAVAGNPVALVSESADVLYHLMVMWVAAGVAPEQVWAELHRREGISGVVEKASRVKPPEGMRKIP